MVAESLTSPRPPETNGVSGCACGTINNNLARVRAQSHFEEMGRGKRAGRWRAVVWPYYHIDDGSMGGGGPIPHVNSIDDEEVYQNDPGYFNPNRRGIFYYGVLCHFFDGEGGSVGHGWGESFLIGAAEGDQHELAQSFIHELGHCIIEEIDDGTGGTTDHTSTDPDDNFQWAHCRNKCAMHYGRTSDRPINYCSDCWYELSRDGIGGGTVLW